MSAVLATIAEIAALGGPVILLLIAASIAVAAVALYKLWQFSAARVGRHAALRKSIAAWEEGDAAGARAALRRSRSYLVPVLALSFDGAPRDRLDAEMEARLAGLERGLRFLDSMAQVAPLLGLFGTVLGMIEAFRALQAAGAQVDPSLLAGGIWVALLTTAAGLAVAMPAALALSWLDGRIEAERVFGARAIATIRTQTAAPAGSAARA